MEHMARAGESGHVITEVVGKAWMDDTDHGDCTGGRGRPRGTSILMHDGEKATSEQDRDRKRRARRMLCPGVHASEELPEGQWSHSQTEQNSLSDLREVRLPGAEEGQEVAAQGQGDVREVWMGTELGVDGNDVGGGAASAMLQDPLGPSGTLSFHITMWPGVDPTRLFLHQ